MVTETKPRPPVEPPDLDVEEEIDVRRYWNTLASRWWLLAAGVVGGLIIGYLVALGSGQVYKATALLYLGQPFAGGNQIQSVNTNPNIVNEIIRSEDAIKAAAGRAGLRPGQLRGNVTTQTIQGPKVAVKANQVPLIQVAVTGSRALKTEAAASALTNQVINQVSGFVRTKITTYKRVANSLAKQLDSVQERINRLNAALRTAAAQGLSPLDRLVLVTQLDNAVQLKGELLQAQANNQQAQALAQNVELPRIIEHPVAAKTTARSTRNSMLVGAVIGLLLGIIAAFLWDPVTRRLSHSHAA